jgi:hypothetical protein
MGIALLYFTLLYFTRSFIAFRYSRCRTSNISLRRLFCHWLSSSLTTIMFRDCCCFVLVTFFPVHSNVSYQIRASELTQEVGKEGRRVHWEDSYSEHFTQLQTTERVVKQQFPGAWMQFVPAIRGTSCVSSWSNLFIHSVSCDVPRPQGT